ncbi:gentisate 1,2-dioxygenase [Candidimonas nitroreducens]|uniref:Gentisate 1,2-dioxygenase n=2 Tax=Candidimonas nitroreducens TaxID=683354 RepID=A0A225MUM8_9BURK|nr:gentisate 1,2-dioxygenase [Candidimonas nitroreducens]
MEGGWHRRRPALWPQPNSILLPYCWHYDQVKPILEAAGALVSTEFAERRNLTMRNPAPDNAYCTVRTMVAAYQMIRPGETADAHRHTPSALRIILDGHGSFTTVDGVRVEMRPGDVLLTPSQSWHSHENIGTEDCYWIDVLDVPLIHLLEPMFFERHPDKLEKVFIDQEAAALAYRWEDSRERLRAAKAAPDGMTSKCIALGNPAMTTIALYVQQLEQGFHSRVKRTTANQILTVLEGEGETHIDGEILKWRRGDVIAVPSWRAYQHQISANAIMVCATDEPVLAKLNLLKSTIESE